MDNRVIYFFVFLILLLAIFGCGKKKIDSRENITVVYGENRTEVAWENADVLENQTKEESVDFTKVYEENSDLNVSKDILEKNEEVDSDLEDILGLID